MCLPSDRTGRLQESDTVGITRHAEANFLVKDVKDLATTIKKAFYLRVYGDQASVSKFQGCDYTQDRFGTGKSNDASTTPHSRTFGDKKQSRSYGRKRPMVYTGGV